MVANPVHLLGPLRERHSRRGHDKVPRLMRFFSSRARKMIASRSARATRTPSHTLSGSSPASARTSARKDSIRWSIGSPPCRLSA